MLSSPGERENRSAKCQRPRCLRVMIPGDGLSNWKHSRGNYGAALSLRSVEGETIHGLTSILTVRCSQCHILQRILTNQVQVIKSQVSSPKYAVNYKAAVCE